MSFEEFKEMYPVQNGSNMVQNCTESISQEAKMCDCHETEKQVCDECQKAKDAADTLDLVPQYADQMVRSRIERLVDAILIHTDLAGKTDNMRLKITEPHLNRLQRRVKAINIGKLFVERVKAGLE